MLTLTFELSAKSQSILHFLCERSAFQGIFHLIECTNTGVTPATPSLESFILVQCLRHFSTEVMSNKMSLYSFKLKLHASLNPVKQALINACVFCCCISSSFVVVPALLFLFLTVKQRAGSKKKSRTIQRQDTCRK